MTITSRFSIIHFNPRSPWGERPETVVSPGLLIAISIHAPRGGSDIVAQVTSPSSSDFNPRSPWGERPTLSDEWIREDAFQSTLPVGGATRYCRIPYHARRISIHAPRGGSDAGKWYLDNHYYYFNPRSPWGERLERENRLQQGQEFQSTLPVGGATMGKQVVGLGFNVISIHAPRGGSDVVHGAVLVPLLRFQSTLPVGGATGKVFVFSRKPPNFNPRPPWGERLKSKMVDAGCPEFQSTLPVGGATCIRPVLRLTYLDFNPRSPWGERLVQDVHVVHLFTISIHAPRGGSDQVDTPIARVLWHFNPRSPWGERPRFLQGDDETIQFQSTLPVGGATWVKMVNKLADSHFNPRSPWGERPAPKDFNDPGVHFNPRSPWGERLLIPDSLFQIIAFQSTLPVGGATFERKPLINWEKVFQSTLPVGGATQ